MSRSHNNCLMTYDQNLLRPIKRTPLFNFKYNTNLYSLFPFTMNNSEKPNKTHIIFSNAIISNKLSKNTFNSFYLKGSAFNRTVDLKRCNDTVTLIKRLNERMKSVCHTADKIKERYSKQRLKSMSVKLYKTRTPNFLIQIIPVKNNKMNITYEGL